MNEKERMSVLEQSAFNPFGHIRFSQCDPLRLPGSIRGVCRRSLGGYQISPNGILLIIWASRRNRPPPITHNGIKETSKSECSIHQQLGICHFITVK